jgi:hypothetical protein
MKSFTVVQMVVVAVLLTGCASVFQDPLRSAYEAGEISDEEYHALVAERDQAFARNSPAHTEFLHFRLENQSKLPPW